MWRTVQILLLGVALSGCRSEQPAPGKYVNVQLTEIDDSEALKAMVAELDARGIKASIMVGATMATQFCEQLRGHDQVGHELMVYGRAPSPTGQVFLADLTLEEQRQHVGDTKQAIEGCLGHSVLGFRSYQFSHDADTWTVLDEVGLRYNLSYIAGTSNTVVGHVDDEWPHRVPGYDFWAVPLHSAQQGNRVSPLCDMPFSGVTAEQWSGTMKSELDATLAAGLPFKVLFHSYFSAHDPGRFQAFLDLLEHARTSGAEFVTTARLVELAAGEEPALAAQNGGLTPSAEIAPGCE